MIKKDPNAKRRYYVNWTKWLVADTIQTSVWVVPTGLTGSSDTHTSTHAYIWVEGGVVGNTYKLVNRITTVAGEIEDQTLEIYVGDK